VQLKFDVGEAVRVVRNLRNDGTYPGEPAGRLLVPRGEVGYVFDIGLFLQDQIIYAVDFMEHGIRVGCRVQELQPETDEWIDNLFEFQDKVTPKLAFAIAGKLIASPGDEGEIEKVIREKKTTPGYHVRFNGRSIIVPESAIQFFQTEHDG